MTNEIKELRVKIHELTRKLDRARRLLSGIKGFPQEPVVLQIKRSVDLVNAAIPIMKFLADVDDGLSNVHARDWLELLEKRDFRHGDTVRYVGDEQTLFGEDGCVERRRKYDDGLLVLVYFKTDAGELWCERWCCENELVLLEVE